MAEPVVRREGKKVYRSTIDRMNAASITRKVAFHSPTCQSAFSKGFYIVSRNLWFVSILGPILVGEEKVAAAEKIIMQSVNKLNESVLKQEALLREVVKGYGYKETATFPKPYEFDADVYHPVAMAYLDMMEAVDRVYALATTLWLKLDMDKEEKIKIEYAMRNKFVQILNTSRATYNTVLKAAKQRNEVAASKVEAVMTAADEADGPMNDQQSAAFRAATAELSATLVTTIVETPLSPDLMMSVSATHDAHLLEAEEKKPRSRKKEDSTVAEAAE